jgi:hypothetical protein
MSTSATRLVSVGFAILVAGCTSTNGDIATACVLGLTSLQTTAAEPEVNACATTDETILAGMNGPERTAAEDCIACVARKNLHEVLCFNVCDGGTCKPQSIAACEPSCSGQSLTQFCARGGVPSQTADLR